MPISRKEHPILVGLAFALLDSVAIGAAYLAAAWYIRGVGADWRELASDHAPYWLVLTFVWLTVAGDQRLLASQRSTGLLPQLLGVTRAVFISIVLTVFLLALFMEASLDRWFITIFGAIFLLFVLSLRLVIRLSVWDIRRRGYGTRRVLFIGCNERTARLVEVIQSHGQYGYHIIGFLDDDAKEDRGEQLTRLGVAYLGPVQQLEHMLVHSVVDLVYIGLPLRSHYEQIRKIAHLCEGIGVPVRLLAEPLPLHTAISDEMALGDVTLLSLAEPPEVQTQAFLRRLVDFVVASVLLLLLAPVFALVALLIKLESRGGPVFERHERLGRNQRLFQMITFRARATSGGGAGHVAEGHDGYGLTRVGRVLRRYNLDELPQLLNIWWGQMSLTGPRPARRTSRENPPRPEHDTEDDISSPGEAKRAGFSRTL